MRVIASYNHPEFKITLYAWNGKFILKFEQSLLEQTYKIPETDFSGDLDIQKLLADEQFLAQIKAQFAAMRNILADFHEKL